MINFLVKIQAINQQQFMSCFKQKRQVSAGSRLSNVKQQLLPVLCILDIFRFWVVDQNS